ncbi:anaerobic sulfatase maturase [Candidatus Epulonipiscium fishelsonii]|uniref:Anaerobic sulfatase maturase n=1 Tax=Candidatus Epulonipiscium fishelsonii TaxID=77094 RepID=A0ACC8XEU7_9FIRM|nr:anaerobic sulfatase maturase [Epulopiscium sp. SCG-B11WGA-EpuloA1]
MPPLNVLMKPASSLCNMNCEYCFYFDEANKRAHSHFGMMSEITLKNIIRKTMLKAEHSITYAYQGGEPTLRGLDFFKTAIKFQKQYNRNGIKVFNALQTNGYEIDESWCEFFRENNFLMGVSIDGTKEIHNAYRHNKAGEDTYEKVFSTTKLFDKYKVEYNILTVVNSIVAQNIEEIYFHYKKNGWHFQQYIPCLDPIGEVRGKNEYALSPQMFGKFMVDLFNLWYQDFKKGKQPYIRQFENYVGILNGYPPESCDMRGTCGIQTVVEADGSVYPCDFYMLDEYKLGNFNENQLEAINLERNKIGFIETSTKLSNKCMECKYLYICKGGCQRNRELNQGSYHNYLCNGYKIFFDETLEEMKKIKI